MRKVRAERKVSLFIPKVFHKLTWYGGGGSWSGSLASPKLALSDCDSWSKEISSEVGDFRQFPISFPNSLLSKCWNPAYLFPCALNHSNQTSVLLNRTTKRLSFI